MKTTIPVKIFGQDKKNWISAFAFFLTLLPKFSLWKGGYASNLI